MEADMADVIANAQAEEDAREAAALRKRSKVLQQGLPRPPPATVELIRNTIPRHAEADDPKTLIQKELVALLEHDNAKYPMTNKSGKPPPVIPELENLDEQELKEKSGYERASLASTAERLAAAQYEFEAVKKIEAAFREAESLGTELQCYRSVHQQEELIAPRRIEAFQEEVKRQSDKESVLQMRYERI
ncbi:hypothetical protein SELMODRAFT_421912 [Selaginella moellendorffii]|uniref:Pre-mRNA splicing factor component Cdc5p/Cef1 C-terminal domain-containing protein n=1 Tax=Selaginella moellendorffii TaxID=88036 RepID=D8SGR1_SELML|nr:hypothetical protein SELMODRAFT_421912 [Selaginella moellendorffii]